MMHGMVWKNESMDAVYPVKDRRKLKPIIAQVANVLNNLSDLAEVFGAQWPSRRLPKVLAVDGLVALATRFFQIKSYQLFCLL